MTSVHVGKIVRRAALIGCTTFFSTCAPSSISSPPPMRPVPEGPALAGRRIGLLDLSHAPSATAEDMAGRPLVRARIAL